MQLAFTANHDNLISMKRLSLAAACLLLCAGLAAASAAAAEPAGMRILDWLEAEAGIKASKPQTKPAVIKTAALGDTITTTRGGHSSSGHGGGY
jgi:hypothetical protein